MENDKIKLVTEKWNYKPTVGCIGPAVPMTEKQSEYIHWLRIKTKREVLYELELIIQSDLQFEQPLHYKHGNSILENQCTKEQATFVIQSLKHEAKLRRKPKKNYTNEPVIYFIQEENGPIKIGKSINLKLRLSTMQTGNAKKLHVLGVIYTKKLEEKEHELHELFKEYRLKGEWFSPNPEILTFINRFTHKV